MIENEIIRTLMPLIIINTIAGLSILAFAVIYPRRERDPDVLEKMHSTFLGVFLREWWYWFINPFIKVFIFFRITPNMLTCFSLIISGISGYFYYMGNFGLAGWLLIVNGALDTLDGRLARVTNQSTRAGAFLDSTLDRYSEALIFMAIAIFFRNNFFILIASVSALIGSELVSYAKARGESVGVTTKRGLMQRPERIMLLSTVSVLSPLISIILVKYNLDPNLLMYIVIVLMAVLTNYTAAVRIVVIFRELGKEGKQDG